jgi:cytochrome b subunit of formate dehydrogenase
MKDGLKAEDRSKGREKVGWFWLALIVAVIFTITGVLLGDIFEAYQTASTL